MYFSYPIFCSSSWTIPLLLPDLQLNIIFVSLCGFDLLNFFTKSSSERFVKVLVTSPTKINQIVKFCRNNTQK